MEKLKNAYKDLTPDSSIARQTREIVTQSEAILNAWVEAAADAISNYNMQDGQKNNTPGGVWYSQRYSYGYFVNKPDMKVTTVGSLQDMDRSVIIQKAIENAKSAGYVNENGNAVVHVNDIDRDVIVGKRALAHGLDRRVKLQAQALTSIGSILENSIRVNELNPRSENIRESYILVGAAKSVDGFYAVSFVVNRHSNEVMDIDVLYAANAKKEPVALLPKITENTATPTGSTVSIATLLEIVNDLYPDILPEDVLKHFGHDSRPEGKLGRSVLYSSRNVQQTKNLVALHNLTEDKLLKTLELGGFPMPSIAVTKADIPHTNFGEITVVFGRETIDPKANRKNTVYSADAWTPTVPQVEYEADGKATSRVYKQLSGLRNQVDDYFRQDLSYATYDIENAVQFVQNSEILYADKKRATSLLRSIGFYMPIELQQSGFVGNITYQGQNVNLYGESFSDVFVGMAMLPQIPVEIHSFLCYNT